MLGDVTLQDRLRRCQSTLWLVLLITAMFGGITGVLGRSTHKRLELSHSDVNGPIDPNDLVNLFNGSPVDASAMLDRDRGKCRHPPGEMDELVQPPVDDSVHLEAVNEIKFQISRTHSLRPDLIWCKIKCIGGWWYGPSCSTDGEDGHYKPMMKPCRLHVPEEKNIILSYLENHKPLVSTTSEVTIPHGTTILARCPALGSMKLLGKSSVQCNHGKWNHRLPTCLPTTPADGLSPYIDDHPPTIVPNVPIGSAGENAAGELVVRPNSVVHLDCVFYRRLGTPVWYWSGPDRSGRSYPSGWAMARQERLWRYRLSIFSIQPRDEGEYTCATPRGHSNSIRIVIQTIECPALRPVQSPLKATIQGNYAGQSVFYSCPDGYRLQGPVNRTCLTTGQWSESRVPHCEFIQCPYDIDGADPRLEFDFLNGAGFGAMIKFSCPSGYQLVGPNNATCQDNMEWSPSPPSCEAIKCEELLPPLNGRIIDSAGSHFVGDSIKFSCNRNFLLVGPSDQLVCTEEGTWSHPSPQCQLSCPHPGLPMSGYLTPNLPGYYEIGATVQVSCQPNLKLHGRPWIVCQQDGSWSAPVGECFAQD